MAAEGGGGTDPAGSGGKNMSVVPLPFFGSTSTISRFCERFRDGQYSLVSFLFAVFLLTVPPSPPCPAISKSGGTRTVSYEVAGVNLIRLFGDFGLNKKILIRYNTAFERYTKGKHSVADA